MIGDEKIVNYAKYCLTCVHALKFEYEDPCHDCLQTPVNVDSRRPVHYKEDKKNEEKNNI